MNMMAYHRSDDITIDLMATAIWPPHLDLLDFVSSADQVISLIDLFVSVFNWSTDFWTFIGWSCDFIDFSSTYISWFLLRSRNLSSCYQTYNQSTLSIHFPTLVTWAKQGGCEGQRLIAQSILICFIVFIVFIHYFVTMIIPEVTFSSSSIIQPAIFQILILLEST